MTVTLGERLKQLRGKKTQQEIADKLEIARASYSHYENNRIEPDNELLVKMAELYNVSVDYLLGRTNDPKDREVFKKFGNHLKNLRENSDEVFDMFINKTGQDPAYAKKVENGEIDLIDLNFLADVANFYNVSLRELLLMSGQVRRASDIRLFYSLLRKEVEEKEKKKVQVSKKWDKKFRLRDAANDDHPDFYKIPVIGKIAAGTPIIANQDILDYELIAIDSNKFKSSEFIILVVEGDSMIGNRIYSGDRVLIHLQDDIESGEIAAVNVNGDDATLKRVEKLENGKVVLLSSNPKYSPIVINNERARIIGKVVKVMFDPNEKK